MKNKVKMMLQNLLISIFIIGICTLAQFSELSFASTIIEVTINPNKVVGTNSFSLGFQLDGSTIYMWRDRSILRELAKSANFRLVRLWSNVIEPCKYWNEATKTGTWYWNDVDSLINTIFDIGAEPLIVLGFYSWESKGIITPPGMAKNPATGLPYPDQWGAYCAEWVKHFKEVNLPVRYYEIINEPYHYWKEDGWPTAQPKLSYFMELFNAAAVSMRKVNLKVQLGNDASIMKGVLDYFISHGERLDFLSYHGYATGSLSTTDNEILKAAETKYISESSSYYGVDKAKQLYKSAKGIDLPVINSENNINYCFSQGTDPRIQKMLGAVYQALTFRTFMIKNYSYNVYFHLASSASLEQRKPSGGAGFGMINSDNNSPWYPYYAHKMLGQNLAVGDKIVESTSTSEDVRVVAWIHEDKLNIMLICKVDSQRTVRLQGVQGQLSYLKIDNTILWKTPSIQSGLLDASSYLTLNGYTVMLLQSKTNSVKTCFEDNFESKSFGAWTGVYLTQGETATVTNRLFHHGTYSAQFSSNGDGVTENAYCYKTISEPEVYARGYIYIASGMPLPDNEDRFYFLRLRSGSQSLVGVGIRRNSGVDKWVLYARSGSGFVGPVYATSPKITMGRWYCIELHWKRDASQGLVEMYVDGIKILSINGINTAYYGNAQRIEFGLITATNVNKALMIYGDCFVLSYKYNGPET